MSTPPKYRISIGGHAATNGHTIPATHYDVQHVEPRAGESTKYQTTIAVTTHNEMTDIAVNMRGSHRPGHIMEKICELHEFLSNKWT